MASKFLEKIESSSSAIKKHFIEDDTPWIIGYSGGKDSSLVVKILLMSLAKLEERNTKKIHLIYCDTGVEIPATRNHIFESIQSIESEAKEIGINLQAKIVRPTINNSFFVKLIGRGYPPPSNKFRWCTDRLRIDPVQSALSEIAEDRKSTVLLGTRYNESSKRNHTLNKSATTDPYIYSQTGHKKTSLLCPIYNFTTDDVWEGLLTESTIKSINITSLSNLYKQISGECPIIKMPDSSPCSKGRFGCWTCTVISKDKATENLIKNGHTELKPLQIFRDWLLEIRNDQKYRCTVRRNGVQAPGPFRISARNEILKKLELAESESGIPLISTDEKLEIIKLWEKDLSNSNYRED